MSVHVCYTQPKVQRAQQEYPIFRREDVTFSALQHQTPITHLAVSNGFVTVVTVGNVILRFNTASPRAVERTCTIVYACVCVRVCVCVCVCVCVALCDDVCLCVW